MTLVKQAVSTFVLAVAITAGLAAILGDLHTVGDILLPVAIALAVAVASTVGVHKRHSNRGP